MRKYEIMLIINPEVENINAVADRIKGYITNNSGSIEKEEDMGIRKLQYIINKKEKGHYYLFQYEIEPKNLPEVERDIKVDEDIMKYLITVTKH